MSKPKMKTWSETVGVHGSKVRVGEREPGGVLYLFCIDGGGKLRKKSLGHRDRKRAIKEAMELANQLLNHTEAATAGRLTLSGLADLYLENGLHGRSEKYEKDTTSKLRRVVAFLGPERYADTLSKSDVDRYSHARKTGRIGPKRSRKAGGVGTTTIWHDLVALNVALNWATNYRDAHGQRLLRENPLRGVSFRKEVSPARPVAGPEYYEALLAVADQVNPKFQLALVLADATGHRIGAILKLRWEDVSFAPQPHAPFGTIRWRRENDKVGNEHVVAMSEPVRDALHHARRAQGAIGGAWIFPADQNPKVPVERHLASRWLLRAEDLAKVPHEKGRGWHSLRRGWASARKGYSDVDVAAAGGWTDLASLKRSYQHADPETMLRVVIGPQRVVAG